MKKLETLNEEELVQQRNTTRMIPITVAVIVGLITLAWIVLGYWRTNIPIFVSTVTLGVILIAATSTIPLRLSHELQRRRNGGSGSQP